MTPKLPAAQPKLFQVVERSDRGPVTCDWLAADFKQLGVPTGNVLMVHTSISALGYIAGGAQLILPALRCAVGADGTLVLPAFSTNSEPANWKRPPVPEGWWQTIRDETPAFDPVTFICEPSLGRLPEVFRLQPGVLRSGHPTVSWCAQGLLAQQVTDGHALSYGLDDRSPLGRCYDADGWVLSLGCRRTTILHLAESRSLSAQRHLHMSGSAMLVDGARQWVTYQTIDDTDEDFEQCRLEYMTQADPADFAEGPTGYGTSRLFRIRPLIDFATPWFDAHRTCSPENSGKR